MTLPPGSRLGPYEIIAMIGAGGMGEVYRARDQRLGRDVAIKVLHASMAADSDQIKRFELEGRACAALNHPNVVAVYDVGIENGSPYIVSELLEGETLRVRLGAGMLAVRRAFEYAVQIANGLTAAHEKGIVHRDLKPENVFVNSDGRLKILDFGLARNAFGSAARAASGEATLTLPGAIMGTISYMSPEQVRGQPADHRSDVFSFGAIFYEMLSGQKAFDQATPAETMSMILREEPPELAGVEHTLPASAELIIRRCIEKAPENRFQSARDLAFALEAVAEGSRTSATHQFPVPQVVAEPVSRWRKSLPLAFTAGLALGAVAVGTAFWFRAPAAVVMPTVEHLTHSGHDTSPTASASGRLIAFVSDRDGRKRIWTKLLVTDNRALPPGGENPLSAGPADDFPRFAPSSSLLLFIRGAAPHSDLYTIPILGGEPRHLLDNVNEADWRPDGAGIAFLRTRVEDGRVKSILGTMGADGASPMELASFDAALAHPRWSPDGKTIALVPSASSNGAGKQQLVLVDAGTKAVRRVDLASPYGVSAVLWTSPREVIYSQADSVAMGDADGSEGQIATIYRQDIAKNNAAPQVMFPSDYGCQFLDRVGAGSLVFDTREPRQILQEFDLQGQGEKRWLAHGNSTDRQPVFSPDGGSILFSSQRAGNPDLWAIGLKSGAVTHITDDRFVDWDPAYTADGSRILFSSNRSGHFEIWTTDSGGSGATQLSQDGVDAENPSATPDGGWVVYTSRNPAKPGLWKMAADGSRATQLVKGDALLPQVSPDGQWVAYVASRTPGSTIIRVARVDTGEPVQPEITIATPNPKLKAGRTRWMPSGKQLVFVGQDERGVSGIFIQDFTPGKDTSATRRKVTSFNPDIAPESFGISPDGTRLITANVEQVFSLMLVNGVPNLAAKTR